MSPAAKNYGYPHTVGNAYDFLLFCHLSLNVVVPVLCCLSLIAPSRRLEATEVTVGRGSNGMYFVPLSAVFLGCASVRCPLTPVLRDAISPYLVEGFECNFAQIFITWMGVAEKVFKVRAQ